MPVSKNRMKHVLTEITDYLENRLIPFWLANGIDTEYGGYLTAFTADGEPSDVTDKLIVSQSRMIWSLISFYSKYPSNKKLYKEARQGLDFFISHFWDHEYGGWFWKVSRTGVVVDDGKVLYGQSFALYALSTYYVVTKENIALEYASKTFDTLQKYATDTLNGGYYENFERDWTLCEAGFAGGERKTLDIHLHFMEAVTVLVQAQENKVHKRKLEELILLILEKMMNKKDGCVFNQFDPAFNPIPAIYVKRTWNAERERGGVVRPPADATAYGYNIELAWLLNRAGEVLGKPDDFYNAITKKLVDYTLKYGFDHTYGGLFRDGTHDGIVLRYDKDFWQSSEAMIGLLDAFERTRMAKYMEAFYLTWDFARKCFINPKTGEWYQLVSREGSVIIDELNMWRSAFHVGRSMMECRDRLQRIVNLENGLTDH